jgi:hypothetical protein
MDLKISGQLDPSTAKLAQNVGQCALGSAIQGLLGSPSGTDTSVLGLFGRNIQAGVDALAGAQFSYVHIPSRLNPTAPPTLNCCSP